jgi:hypothetical protein
VITIRCIHVKNDYIPTDPCEKGVPRKLYMRKMSTVQSTYVKKSAVQCIHYLDLEPIRQIITGFYLLVKLIKFYYDYTF